MKRTALTLGVLALAVSAQSAVAQQIGTVGQGLMLARTVCAECHNIQKGAPPAARNTAPNFETLAKTPGMTTMALRVALQTSHMKMPNLMLKEEDRESVIAYIQSLK
jgi:mono/diheme cytochrome c family protein